MKNIEIYILTICFTFLISCESHEQKSETYIPQDEIVEIDTLTKKAIIPEKKIEVKKEIQIDEWIKFKKEVEKKTLEIDIKIAEIKKTPDLNNHDLKVINKMIKKNEDLKKSILTYENEQLKFKEQLKSNLDLVIKELHEIKQIK